jgi:Fuc2NAc and GlcNAc transferase
VHVLLSLATSIGVFVLSVLLTGLLRRYLATHGVLDVPNERSSHTTVTPRGGGLSIVLAATGGLLALALIGFNASKLLTVLVSGGAIVAVVGYVDDRRGLSPGVKLVAHLVVALWTVAWVGAPQQLALFHGAVAHLGWSGQVLAVLGVIWVLNLFNFMDGIDGLAASEGVFVLCAAAALTLLVGVSRSLATADLVLGVACLGFLVWNWPPARIFMGDAGSSYLGYAIAVLALAAAGQSPVAVWVWLILGGVFFVDATVTLLRRLSRGEPVHDAHRSHAYQWLARRWGHLDVTLGVCAINVFWLLPCAIVAVLRPADAAAIALIALVPLACVALIAGAGRAEAGKRAAGVSEVN